MLVPGPLRSRSPRLVATGGHGTCRLGWLGSRQVGRGPVGLLVLVLAVGFEDVADEGLVVLERVARVRRVEGSLVVEPGELFGEIEVG